MDEVQLSDGISYNYNCRPIPLVALKALIAKKPELASECGATADDVDKGRATGLMFVSERDSGLETLHVALRFNGEVKVDSVCFGTSLGHNADPSVIYVSTKKVVEMRRTPWTVVYRTNLRTGKTKQLTPDGQYDLSPAVSPSGTRVAVATFRSGEWKGEIEHLKTDIVLMNVDRHPDGGGLDRGKPIIEDGGWPSWGSDNVIFFHRGIDEREPTSGKISRTTWGVFRYDLTTKTTERVTPEEFDAMTPAAISETKVAVATIRQRTYYMSEKREERQYRHIEVFDLTMPDKPSVRITHNVFPKADYYNPFVLDGGSHIGYNRVRTDKMNHEVQRNTIPYKV
ncbi:hypothetical protein PR202_gb15930 [Eleusine coracana subsp. coracana]|uniref:Uncharacterized protein n=1 Tax=Eleusine coracana subsp. coracana TaxID=191504 RepID=A0AAV5EZ67_ELECO|nr:hypothetical protein PR202_gb15930 [Eleusine coracana subsp. coracana]